MDKSIEFSVEDAEDTEALLAYLRVAGLENIADRIGNLATPGSDLEDDEQPASFDSIRALTISMRDLKHLGEPMIGLSDGGVLVAEWLLANDKHLAVEYRDNLHVTFALIAPGANGDDRCRLNGTGSVSKMLAACGTYDVHRWNFHEG